MTDVVILENESIICTSVPITNTFKLPTAIKFIGCLIRTEVEREEEEIDFSLNLTV